MMDELTEVEWYKIYGKYQDRIAKDSKGNEYVIGDFSWNHKKQLNKEIFEPKYQTYLFGIRK